MSTPIDPPGAGGRSSRFLRELTAIRAFILRDVDLTKRYLGWDVVWLVYNLINAAIIGLIGVSSGAAPSYVPGGQPYIFYLLIGAIMWSYMSVLFIIVAETVAWERWEGTLEYTFMAPIHRLTHLFGVCAFAVLYGIVRIILMLLVLVLVFHLDLSHANLLAALVVLVIGSFAMVGHGPHRRGVPAALPGERRAGDAHHPGGDPAGQRRVLPGGGAAEVAAAGGVTSRRHTGRCSASARRCWKARRYGSCGTCWACWC